MRISDIEHAQEVIRCDMLRALNLGDVERVVKLVETFSEVTLRLNNIKYDQTVETVLKDLSEKYIGVQPHKGKNKDNLIVFYDQIGTTVCLGLQYLRGIIASGYDVVYIYDNYRSDISPKLLNIIKSLDIEYRLYGPSMPIYKDNVYKGKIVYDYINELQPDKIVMHASPSQAIGMSVMYALPYIEKFFIVPGDHHFYSGLHAADYLFEFRKFGITVSITERGISKDKIYKLPFYPIVEDLAPFEGYPFDFTGKTVFATAGATYKFIGSDIIFEIWDYILRYNDTVIIYMGKADKCIKKYSTKHKERFFVLGYRKDFNQCIKNANILVNSYPIGGGLVTQTAAAYEKPIVAYCDEKEYLFQNLTDVFGGDGDKVKLSKTSIEDLKEYVYKLINDFEYRKFEGEKARSNLQTKERFDKSLRDILTHNALGISMSDVEPYDREYIMYKYLKQQNKWHPTVFVPLILQYGLSFFWKFRFMFRDILKNPLYVGKFILLFILVKTKLR